MLLGYFLDLLGLLVQLDFQVVLVQRYSDQLDYLVQLVVLYLLLVVLFLLPVVLRLLLVVLFLLPEWPVHLDLLLGLLDRLDLQVQLAVL